jgi:glycine/D-amino acid oxidase-like deaminating enzyme
MYLLETARQHGVRFESACVTGVDVTGGSVKGVRLGSGERVDSPVFINAAGPYLQDVGRLLGVELPIHTELHLKAAIKDPLGVVAREAPLLIWNDPQSLPWEEEERQALAEDEEIRWLTEPFPSGVHTRPEGAGESQTILMLWEYQTKVMAPVWPPQIDDQYPEVALRGLSTMLPRMKEYFGRMPRPQLDGGYYTKTQENRPLVGPMDVDGAYVLGAVSGYGIMSACGVGDLLAKHVTGAQLPSYASAFVLARYDDPQYRQKLETWTESGQL